MDKLTVSDAIDKTFGFDHRYFSERGRRRDNPVLMEKWILVKEADDLFNNIIRDFVSTGSPKGITLDFSLFDDERIKPILERLEQRVRRRMDDYKVLNKMLM